jgi:hypothetical protein
MEGLNPYGGIGCHLPKEEKPEMARYILKAPDLTREVVLQDLNDPPIPFPKDDGSDLWLNHFFSPGTILHTFGPRPGMPGPRIGLG